MDRPAVDRADGVPPAIAIDQTNPVRTSRSTVGTMTELNDHLKLLFARAAQLSDRQTALQVRHDTPQTIHADLLQRAQAAGDPRLVFSFPAELPADTSVEQQEQWLSAAGFTRVQVRACGRQQEDHRRGGRPAAPGRAQRPCGCRKPSSWR
jgi:excinuclease ABC subunit A